MKDPTQERPVTTSPVEELLRVLHHRQRIMDDADSAVAAILRASGHLGALLDPLRQIRQTALIERAKSQLAEIELEAAGQLWAVRSLPSLVQATALSLCQCRDFEALDDFLAAEWYSDWGAEKISQVLRRIPTIGAHLNLARVYDERTVLLRRSWEAATKVGVHEFPIVVIAQQIDGVMIDLTGDSRKFFFKSNTRLRHDLPSSGYLAALQEAFRAPVEETNQGGSARRHGVAHGRTLAYGTRANAARYWALLEVFTDYCLEVIGQASNGSGLAD